MAQTVSESSVDLGEQLLQKFIRVHSVMVVEPFFFDTFGFGGYGYSYGDGRGCYVLIKFDDEKPTRYEFQEFGDKNDRIMSFDRKLLNKIMHAKHMTARLYFFQNGSVDFEFNVEGLKRPDLKEKKKKKA